jgi:hypothetical protein
VKVYDIKTDDMVPITQERVDELTNAERRLGQIAIVMRQWFREIDAVDAK